MNLDNFVVRPHRKLVEKYSKRRGLESRWPAEEFDELSHRLAAFPPNWPTTTKRPSGSTCWSSVPSSPSFKASPDFRPTAKDSGDSHRTGGPGGHPCHPGGDGVD